MRGLLWMMLKEEFRMHASYSGRAIFLSFPAFVVVVAFAIAVTSEQLFAYTPLADAMLVLHVSVFLYGLSVGAFGFLGRQYLERQTGNRNYLVTMPSILPMSFRRTFLGMYVRDAIFYAVLLLLPMTGGLLLSVPITGFRVASIGFLGAATAVSFLLGMSLSFFLSTVWMRSPGAFYAAATAIGVIFGLFGLARMVPPEVVLPGLSLQFAGPPFAVRTVDLGLAALAGVGTTVGLVTGAVWFVQDHYESRGGREEDELPSVDRKLDFLREYRTLLAKELVDLKRSGAFLRMFFSFVAPLVFLSFTAWYVRYGLRVPVGFNAVFYGAMVGFFGILLYNWLNNVDTMDYLSTLPVAVPQVIRAKVLAFLVLTTWIGAIFVVGISWLNGDTSLLWLALPVMFVTSLYMVVMTAYLTGLRPSSFLFDPKVLLQFSALSMTPDLGLTILSFTIDRDLAFAGAGIALTLALLGLATVFLYRGLDAKWGDHDFAE